MKNRTTTTNNTSRTTRLLQQLGVVFTLAFALSACGGSSSSSSTVTPTAVPAVASNLSASNITTSSITIAWTAVSNATFYQVLRDSAVVSSSTTNTQYSDSGLNSNTAYAYTVMACNNGGCSSASASVSIQTAVFSLFLSYSRTKNLHLHWDSSSTVNFYLLEKDSGDGSFNTTGNTVTHLSTLTVSALSTSSHSFSIPLHNEFGSYYRVSACTTAGSCRNSNAVQVNAADLVNAIGYVKASNTGTNDEFGRSISLSGDGNTLAVGAWSENSNATGINGNQSNNSAFNSGAVYVFSRSSTNNQWQQQAYIKASNTESNDAFGWSVSLNDDGNTLAVGAIQEDSTATGINGNGISHASTDSGAVYVFSRSSTNQQWSQQAYVKASNTDAGDSFGVSVSLSNDGNTLAVGATLENSNATGINGNQSNNSANDSGAVYVFSRSTTTNTWSQQAYVKASNIGASDGFGWLVGLSGDGNTLVVSAIGEDSNATGVNGNETNNSASNSGAVYVFSRSSSNIWSQQAYVKASNTGSLDVFGWSVSLSNDGNTLAVGASFEDSRATGINGNQSNNSVSNSGAVYVFSRSSNTWSQQAFIKASNTGGPNELFGASVSLSSNGNTLAVGAPGEESNATGINGDETNNAIDDPGAVYVFSRNSSMIWSQRSYIKASNSGMDDVFGFSVSLSSDSNTLAVGANFEDSSTTGINGNQSNNSTTNAGAVYLY